MRSTLKPLFPTLLFISAVGTAFATDDSSNNFKASDTSAIIGDAESSISTFRWIAYLAYGTGEQYCGASLISPTWILTAVHCFLNEAGDEIDIETSALSTIFFEYGHDSTSAAKFLPSLFISCSVITAASVLIVKVLK